MAEEPERDLGSRAEISDEDVYEAMKDVRGYLDITPSDFKEVYRLAYRHAVRRIAGSLRARDIMSRNVLSVRPDTPLHEVASTMARRGISGVPVLDDDNRVVGVISEKDFLHRMGGTGRKGFMAVIAQCLRERGCVAAPIKAKQASDIMSAPAVTVPEDATLMEIADLLAARNINRVPVVDAGGRLAGIVSRQDVVAGFSERKCG